MNYENNLKQLRVSTNHSQEEIANILNIDRTTYNHYENNHTTIPIKHLIVLSEYYNISIDYIFNFNNDKDLKLNTISLEKASLRLKEFRKENKLTQAKLANILNTNQSVIANYERGRNLIATPFLYTICLKYNISADYLLGLSDEPKYIKNND